MLRGDDVEVVVAVKGDVGIGDLDEGVIAGRRRIEIGILDGERDVEPTPGAAFIDRIATLEHPKRNCKAAESSDGVRAEGAVDFDDLVRIERIDDGGRAD